jgi:hypothetical protein
MFHDAHSGNERWNRMNVAQQMHAKRLYDQYPQHRDMLAQRYGRVFTLASDLYPELNPEPLPPLQAVNREYVDARAQPNAVTIDGEEYTPLGRPAYGEGGDINTALSQQVGAGELSGGLQAGGYSFGPGMWTGSGSPSEQAAAERYATATERQAARNATLNDRWEEAERNAIERKAAGPDPYAASQRLANLPNRATPEEQAANRAAREAELERREANRYRRIQGLPLIPKPGATVQEAQPAAPVQPGVQVVQPNPQSIQPRPQTGVQAVQPPGSGVMQSGGQQQYVRHQPQAQPPVGPDSYGANDRVIEEPVFDRQPYERRIGAESQGDPEYRGGGRYVKIPMESLPPASESGNVAGPAPDTATQRTTGLQRLIAAARSGNQNAQQVLEARGIQWRQ